MKDVDVYLRDLFDGRQEELLSVEVVIVMSRVMCVNRGLFGASMDW